jgi:hypothetical protein
MYSLGAFFTNSSGRRGWNKYYAFHFVDSAKVHIALSQKSRVITQLGRSDEFAKKLPKI